MINKNKNAATNEMLMLGVGILIIGLILGVYSISTYVEVKNLSDKIDFELIDSNTKLTSSDKFYEYQNIAEFLTKKLEQNKSIPIKNTACVYLNYANKNAVLMYDIADKKLEADPGKKNTAASNIRTLYGLYDSYKGCKQSAQLKTELGQYLSDIENATNSEPQNNDRMNKFLNGYKEKKQAELEQAAESDTVVYPDNLTEEEKQQLDKDMDSIRQWQSDEQR